MRTYQLVKMNTFNQCAQMIFWKKGTPLMLVPLPSLLISIKNSIEKIKHSDKLQTLINPLDKL